MSYTRTLTIANGATVSSTMQGQNGKLYGVVIPAAFTGVAITFQVSADNATFQALYDITGTVVSVTVAQGRSYDLPGELVPWPSWKIVSGTAEGGARSLVVVAKS